MTQAETTNREPSAGTVTVATPPDDPETLRAYTRAKLALASQLHALREVIKQRGCEARLQQCDELMVKLAEDRFTLAVLGQFKRGKSSLMNAIIGRELLPVGVLPLTSAITVLRYGPKERLLITRTGEGLPWPEEFAVERLPEFVTEHENPGNTKRVKTAVVEVPVPFLRRGLEFVDTPGVGSAIEANTATTMAFLPECDAVLFVTSVDSPFTQVELEFLQSIREHVHKIFVIVNKTDLLAVDERRDVLDFVSDTIRRRMGVSDVKIFPVSSKLGLSAKDDGGWSDSLESGLADLEATLARFLSGEKSSVFLLAIIERALWLLQQEAAEVGLRRQAGELPERVLVEKLEKVTAQWESHKAERRQAFERLQQRILSSVDTVLMPDLRTFIRTETAAFAATVERLLNSVSWFPLGKVWDKAEETAMLQTRKDTLAWLSVHAENLTFSSDTAAQADWKGIQSNLADLPVIASDIFGVRSLADGGGEALSPFHLKVKFENLPAFNFQCRIRLPFWPSLLPVCLARRWLKKFVEKGAEQLANKWLDAVILHAADNVRKTLEHLGEEVEKQANGIGLRLMASLRGQPVAIESGDGKLVENAEADEDPLNAIRLRLLALRDEVCPRQSLPNTDLSKTLRVKPIGPPRLFRVSRALPTVKLSEPNFSRDLETRACPVCNHVAKSAFEFFARFQYDLSRDEATQESFAETLGFCALHTWQLEAIASPVGLSVGFAKLAEHVSRLLTERTKSAAHSHVAVKLVRGSTECHVCRLLREVERNYLQQLTKFIASAEGRATYARSQGVCLRHLGLWFPLLNTDESTRFVLEEAARHFEQMSEDMRSYSLKSDALRRQLQNADENDAYLRAITHLVGAKQTCQPMSGEAEV